MKLTIRETTVFAFLGTLMFVSKLLMEGLPNVHLLAVFIISFTVVYRWKALFPIYVFVFLCGLYTGFNAWWIPYLYVWTLLWGAAMLIPKGVPGWLRPIVYGFLAACHGFLFGTLYAPVQALMFGLDFKETVAWIILGLRFDVVHGFGNLVLSMMIVPLIALLKRLDRKRA